MAHHETFIFLQIHKGASRVYPILVLDLAELRLIHLIAHGAAGTVQNEWALSTDSVKWICIIHRQLNTLCVNKLLFTDNRIHYPWSTYLIQLIRWSYALMILAESS